MDHIASMMMLLCAYQTQVFRLLFFICASLAILFLMIYTMRCVREVVKPSSNTAKYSRFSIAISTQTEN